MVETAEEMCWRVARAIAAAEGRFGRSPAAIAEIAAAFYEVMVDGAFLPNSPTLMNAGKDNQLQYSACFVLPVGDSMPEIFEAVKSGAIIHQSGGGTGFAFSRLRPKNDVVKSTGGRASGPVSFLRVFNAATEAVKQGGIAARRQHGHPARRPSRTSSSSSTASSTAASPTSTSRWPPPTRSWTRSPRATDYDLVNPRTGAVTGRLSARDVFDRIVRAAWRTGDPGMVFIDRINRSRANPTPDVAQIEATNPCVIGDTLIGTDRGLVRATPWPPHAEGEAVQVDARSRSRVGEHPRRAVSDGASP